MPDDEGRGFAGGVRRFVRWPREVPRGPAQVVPLARVGLFSIAAGAGIAALGWGDQVVLMALGPVYAMADDVIKGVRHRWPGFAVGLAAGWGSGVLARAAASAPADPDWADWPALAAGSLVALVAFAAVTRLPDRPGTVQS
ncbi:hypothetical protein BKI49_25680 [Streptomyces sp. Tue6028]|uniref:hypothetical protein n=1 Tax=Streptomyces sp. Tue6028 TaxID=2036037 RepID=UPI000BB2DDFF|nr:hypothetical protein [Streptomyces sp. Tue6028]PBC61377.1 hypothetical protein BKI49_25680 [Streptomyces sp. Tue6028]